MSEQFLGTFRPCSSSIGNGQVSPQGFDSLTMLRGFPDMLTIFSNEALVIPDQTGDLLLTISVCWRTVTSCCI